MFAGQYHTTPPTLPDKGQEPLQMDTRGNLKVTLITKDGTSAETVVVTAAATEADGANVALGSTTDAAVGDATGTLNAHARQIAKLLAAALTANATLSAETTKVIGTVNVSASQSITAVVQKQTTATPARVASSATSVTLLASNASRISAIIFNESTQIVYVKYGTTASATDYTVQIVPLGTLVVANYTGRIDGIWVSANGAAQVTEL